MMEIRRNRVPPEKNNENRQRRIKNRETKKRGKRMQKKKKIEKGIDRKVIRRCHFFMREARNGMEI